MNAIKQYIPILNWGLHYRREYLVGDITAGIIVASLLIPQGMAYAMLAGLPPEVGLYASILPLIVYACLGTSSNLSVAPAAVDSLMVAAAVSAFAAENTAEYLGLALTLAGIVGIIEIIMGFFHLGFLVNFLSQSVISGFISAAAILIGCSQVKHLLGVSIPQSESFFQLVSYLGAEVGNTNGVTLMLGLTGLGILIFFNKKVKYYLKQWRISEVAIVPITKSAPLLLVIISSLLVWGLRLDEMAGVKVVGTIPQGLPPISLPIFDATTLQQLFPAAVAISFVGFMEAFAVGSFLGSKKRQKLDANQELIALGAANASAAFTGGYPVTGGLARSVVNFAAGANTGLASIVTAVVIAITVMFLTPLFYFLPQTILAAIILVAVVNLLDFGTLKRLWGYDKGDAIAWCAAFIAVLATSVETGILIGAAISLALHLWRTSKPHIAIVGRIENTEHFRNIERHSVKTCPHVLAIRIDESLYFANAKYLQNYVQNAIATYPEIKHLVLVCSAVNVIDGSGLETLKSLIYDLKSVGIDFYLAEVKGPVLDKLEKIGFTEFIGGDRIFLTTDIAMKTLECQ